MKRCSAFIAHFVLFAISISAPAWAVDCIPDDIILTSQADVDDFQTDHGPCDRVVGLLLIEGQDVLILTGLSDLVVVDGSFSISSNPELIDLDGLSSLTQVNRLRIVGNEALVSLEGLANLSEANVIDISHNNNLRNLNGLMSLTQLSELVISSNSVLVNFVGLTALRKVERFYIVYNQAIANLEGLSALEEVDVLWIDRNSSLISLDGLSPTIKLGDLNLERNPILNNLECLSSITSIGRNYLAIIDNDGLMNLDGLSSLERVDGSLIIERNDNLTNLDGLLALTKVGAESGNRLNISLNPALTNLDGLSHLRAVSGHLLVAENHSLNNCTGITVLIDPIDDYEPGPGSSGVPDVGGYVGIGGNLPGCNSISEVLAEAPILKMNPGLNDAWFNLETDGQGFLITVFPEIEQIFMAWFTYDTERPPADVTAILGEPGHRWLTAQGEYEENVATLDVYVTAGGVFDSPKPEAVTEPYGEIMLEFSTCNVGTVTYDIPSIDRQGVILIERIVLDNVPLCYFLNSEAAEEATKQ